MSDNSIWNKLLNSKKGSYDVGISPDRLMAFNDAIFAIAITLLILTIALPDASFEKSRGVLNFLFASARYMVTVLISFIILGEYWIQQHHFIKLEKIDIKFLWMNIFYLLFIMFIPFSTSLMCKYDHLKISEVIFGFVITVSSLLSLLMYWYASKNDLLEVKNKVENRYAIKSLSFLIIITIIINLLVYFVSPLALVLFILIPIISVFLEYKRNKEMDDKKIEIYDKSSLLTNIKKDRIIEFMLTSKIEEYINENYPNYDELDEEEKVNIKLEALEDLEVQLDIFIDMGKKEVIKNAKKKKIMDSN